MTFADLKTEPLKTEQFFKYFLNSGIVCRKDKTKKYVQLYLLEETLSTKYTVQIAVIEKAVFKTQIFISASNNML